ncbi:hypothetical protein CCO03_02165 [Comamonas serinivorans]|uniref:DUF2304 domain-containing protein n=2 Tax=Comamonas serinivorans TaxID=1082851 RepID=A0A1Y0ESE7_9BURK|nr:DUF2304 domain-containing protein [Comamonas serinivorans]ARU06587.1 hypothetical protein CCO03_02165 [Comamonas serinivorans]
MSALHITTALLGLGLAVLILRWIRRDQLYLGHGLFWIAVAVAAMVLGLWPRLIDRLATWTGVFYPPAFLLLLAVLVLLVKALHSDLVNTRMRRNLRRLNQSLALQEQRLQHLEDARAASTTPPETP